MEEVKLNKKYISMYGTGLIPTLSSKKCVFPEIVLALGAGPLNCGKP